MTNQPLIPVPQAISKKSMQKLLEANNLNSVIIFGTAPGGIFHMAIHSRSPETEDKLAQLANRVQAMLGWPPNMELMSDRYHQAKEKIRVLEAKVQELQHALDTKDSSGV